MRQASDQRFQTKTGKGRLAMTDSCAGVLSAAWAVTLIRR